MEQHFSTLLDVPNSIPFNAITIYKKLVQGNVCMLLICRAEGVVDASA